LGTFHRGRGELHGMTVVVETTESETYVGRYDQEDAAGILLLDADLHRGEPGETSRAEFLERAARLGVWPKLRRVIVPRERVTAVRRLGEIPAAAPGGEETPS
jgi:hypothetical protein